MAKYTAEEAAKKQAEKLKSSLEYVKQGINRVSVAPTAQAATKKDKMLAHLTESVNNGKWERGLGRVTLEDWKASALNKGVQRIPAGIDAAFGKQVKFYSELLPFQDALVSKIKTMPDMTIEDSVARSAAMIRGMKNFKRTA